MRVRHPYALDDDAPAPDDAVHWGGRRDVATVDDDGTFEVPDDATHTLDRWADGYGYDLDDLVVTSNGAHAASAGSSQSGGNATGSAADPTCAGTTAAGEPCTRPVDAAGDYCFDHDPED